MIQKSDSLFNTIYSIPITDNDEKHKSYCSGLVFYSFLNSNKKPSLRILTKNNLSNVLGLKIYMPRTICNSPYVYTRIWYKR